MPEMLIEPLLRNGIGERTDDVAMVTKRIAESYTEEIIKKLTAHGYKAVSYTHLDVYKRQA